MADTGLKHSHDGVKAGPPPEEGPDWAITPVNLQQLESVHRLSDTIQ